MYPHPLLIFILYKPNISNSCSFITSWVACKRKYPMVNYKKYKTIDKQAGPRFGIPELNSFQHAYFVNTANF